ncbi:MAG: transcription elongation factor GreA [Solobacterium sp.]|nr:transcription elongation factor GreA [Solobacterium sp.]
MAEQKKIYLTEEGLQDLKEEHHRLVTVEREKNKKDLAEARSQGDLSENADWDAAREKQAQLESLISEIEWQLNNYVLIDMTNVDKSVVNVGSTVTIEFLDVREEAKYKIVGSTQTDPSNGLISNDSPLAAAIMNHKIGDTVTVNVKKPYSVIIINIE